MYVQKFMSSVSHGCDSKEFRHWWGKNAAELPYRLSIFCLSHSNLEHITICVHRFYLATNKSLYCLCEASTYRMRCTGVCTTWASRVVESRCSLDSQSKSSHKLFEKQTFISWQNESYVPADFISYISHTSANVCNDPQARKSNRRQITANFATHKKTSKDIFKSMYKNNMRMEWNGRTDGRKYESNETQILHVDTIQVRSKTVHLPEVGRRSKKKLYSLSNKWSA